MTTGDGAVQVTSAGVAYVTAATGAAYDTAGKTSFPRSPKVISPFSLSRVHEEIKCHALSEFCPTSERQEQERVL